MQEHELSLVRDYEKRLLEREEQAATQDLITSTAVSHSLARLSNSLRQFTRSLNGEDQGSEPTASGEGGERDGAGADWAMSREIALARLENENGILRRMLGVPSTPWMEEADRQALEFSRGMNNPVHGRTAGGMVGAFGKRTWPAA